MPNLRHKRERKYCKLNFNFLTKAIRQSNKKTKCPKCPDSLGGSILPRDRQLAGINYNRRNKEKRQTLLGIYTRTVFQQVLWT